MGSTVNGIYVPDVAESGWGTSVSNDMRRLSEVGANVKAFGALGDGTTDDTSAIAAAITACPEGGTVFFPSGQYLISTLTITKNVTLAGAGYWSNPNISAFGDSTWSSGNYGTYFYGSVIRSTNTTTRAIYSATTGKQIQVRDLLVIGPGSGTSNGIEVGTAAIYQIGMHWDNVQVANFGGAGFRFLFAVSNAFYGLTARCCKTGFSLSDTCNDNQFFRTEVQHSDTDGILLVASNGNRFYGGLVQGVSGTAGIRCNSAQQDTFDGFWFESVTATNAVKFGPTGTHGNSLWNSWFGSDGGTVNIDAANLCMVGRIRGIAPGGNITITAGSTSTMLIAIDNVTVTDAGTDTIILAAPTFKVPATGFNIGSDVNLYRSGTNILKSDDNLFVGLASAEGSVTINGASGSASYLYIQKAGGNKWHIGRTGADDRFSIVESGVAEHISIPVTTGDLKQLTAGSFHELKENGTTDPAAGAANTARLYCKDNGAGKTQLVVRFNTGAVQVIATEP